MRRYTETEMQEMLYELCQQAGGMRKWAIQNGLDYSKVHKVYNGKRPFPVAWGHYIGVTVLRDDGVLYGVKP